MEELPHESKQVQCSVLMNACKEVKLFIIARSLTVKMFPVKQF